MELYRREQDRQLIEALYEALLDSWSVPTEAQPVAGRFGETHVLTAGPDDAPPLLLIPGAQGTAAMWGALAEGLARDYRLYCVDLIDQIGRSRPTRVLTSPADCASWIVEVIDGLGLVRPALIGNSIGSFVAASAAVAHPERVSHLVLTAPAATVAPLNPTYLLRVLLTMASPLPGASRRFVRNTARGRLAEDDPLFRLLSEAMRRTRVISKLVPAKLRRSEMDKLTMPMLVLLGAEDPVYPGSGQALCEALRKRSATAAELVPAAGHLWNATDWSRSAERTRSFLRSHGSF